jgi:AraC-like DNA-binding protein
MLEAVNAPDVLSELLSVIRLDSAIFFNAEFTEPWRVVSKRAEELTPMFAPGTAHVIIYHLVVEGRAFAQLNSGGERLELGPGDLVTLTQGDGHTLGAGGAAPALDAVRISDALDRGLGLVRAGGGGIPTRIVCGFLACDPQLAQSLLGALPPLLKVSIRDAPESEWLLNSIRMGVAESTAPRAGSGAILAKLSEAMFAETLRRYVQALPEGGTGWLAGARDADVGKALAILHRSPAAPWTVASLARAVGVSRTVLSDRFKHFLGEPPMAYLTRWRLQLGARALTSSTRGIGRIAGDVGYESEAAFNRAFKRGYGVPPARYRKQRTGG